MSIKIADDIKANEITPKELYISRRSFLKNAALVSGSVALGLSFAPDLFGAIDTNPQTLTAVKKAPTARRKNRIHSRTSPTTITSTSSAPAKATPPKTPNISPLALGPSRSKAKLRNRKPMISMNSSRWPH